MMRVAYLFCLIAIAVMFPLALDLSGRTAILFVFVGFPAMALAILIYVVSQWRAGAFHFKHGSRT